MILSTHAKRIVVIHAINLISNLHYEQHAVIKFMTGNELLLKIKLYLTLWTSGRRTG